MDREFLSDLFADFGPVTIRRMFSGYGISVDGVNFALSLRSGLFFRADDETVPRFASEGSKPFSYQKGTRTVTVASYWELPARLFDDTEELSEWAGAALGAAQRAALKKRTRKPRKTKKVEAEKAEPKKATARKANARAPVRAGTKSTGKAAGKKTRPPAKSLAKSSEQAGLRKTRAKKAVKSR